MSGEPRTSRQQLGGCDAWAADTNGSLCFALGAERLAAVRLRFSPDEQIFCQGAPAEHVYKIMSGVVRNIRYAEDGARQILRFHFTGDLFGIDSAPLRTHGAETITDVELLAVRSAALKRAAEADGASAGALMDLVLEELRLTQEHTHLLGLKTARERVFTFLLKLASQTGQSSVELAMSRADIANHLGLSLETVSRTFTQLVQAGAISLPRSRCVVLNLRDASQIRRPVRNERVVV